MSKEISDQERIIQSIVKFTEEIEKSENIYLKTLLRADPGYQTLALYPKFAETLTTLIASIVDLLMRSDLNGAPNVMRIIVETMRKAIDEMDVQSSCFRIRQVMDQEKENIIQKLDVYSTYQQYRLDRYMKDMYNDLIERRKSWILFRQNEEACGLERFEGYPELKEYIEDIFFRQKETQTGAETEYEKNFYGCNCEILKGWYPKTKRAHMMLEGWLKQFLTANLALIDGMRQKISEIS